MEQFDMKPLGISETHMCFVEESFHNTENHGREITQRNTTANLAVRAHANDADAELENTNKPFHIVDHKTDFKSL
ncbi:hypothetical protein CDAR_618671 [Caerostris darwini]|uniref:Uncharacterized protein n=1 Tax=Caerostris darwini TaxID=1538125 RepID=A0AAV4WSZ1_9ARAC|nr:hypothetical protein CDAR_618671 [Caerostris darwini]